jgi:hypothetical protein
LFTQAPGVSLSAVFVHSMSTHTGRRRRTEVSTRDHEREPGEALDCALAYLARCSYPASVDEVAERVRARVGGDAGLSERLRERHFPALAEREVVRYDPESDLVCLVR